MKNIRSVLEQGYSLAELLVVVAIVGMLTLVTVPQFMALYRSANFKGTMRQFNSVVRNARQIAITKNERVRVTYKTGTIATTYTVEQENPANTWTQTGITHNLDTGSYFDSSSNFPVSGTTGKQEIYFYNNGTMAAVDGTAVGQPANVIIRNPAFIAFNQYTINVNNTGRVSVTGSKWQ